MKIRKSLAEKIKKIQSCYAVMLEFDDSDDLPFLCSLKKKIDQLHSDIDQEFTDVMGQAERLGLSEDSHPKIESDEVAIQEYVTELGRRLKNWGIKRRVQHHLFMIMAVLMVLFFGFKLAFLYRYRLNGIVGEYYSDTNLNNLVSKRRDRAVNFQWGFVAPMKKLPEEAFSVRWTGLLQVPKSGSYRFTTLSDDGIRLWIDGQLLIDDWVVHIATFRSGDMVLEKGLHQIKVEYFQQSGDAVARLYWKMPDDQKEIVIDRSLSFGGDA